eukprot:4187120-Amphidinium_carterae.1
MKQGRSELELIEESVIEVNADVEADVEDVDRSKLVHVDALEDVDELELVERSVVEVNVDVEVDRGC